MEGTVAVTKSDPLALDIAQLLLRAAFKLAGELFLYPVQSLILKLGLGLDATAHGHCAGSVVHALAVGRCIFIAQGHGCKKGQ
jgi:hypothetical protein